ncbi:MlaE family ABC transporter permease [Nitrincola sp.]|uniref:MlaE family ABC transporter permease n=1 Tax=Nitrincola sp. TaxID=1926584 RepID=UPI003A934ECD
MSEQAELPMINRSGESICVVGSWDTRFLAQQQLLLQSWRQSPPTEAKIDALDTNGAVVLLQLVGFDSRHWPQGLTQEQIYLLTFVKGRLTDVPTSEKRLNPLAELGRQTLHSVVHARQLLDFAGQLSVLLLSLVKHPRQLKVKLLLDVVQRDGLNAVPIIALLAFLLGAVIAFQGGLQLATYGANIFVVELISLIMLRELAPLICAIIVAGRSGSAYAAQLATMQMNQEVVALKSLGQDPFVWLVLPKLLGLMLVMPLLTVLSMLAGIGGGMLVASIQLDLGAVEFIQRFASTVDPVHFWVGLIKAPVFALLIVNVGCMQGFLAKGGAEAVGHRTTRSVVQSIFLVIIVDALFSILFAQLGW